MKGELPGVANGKIRDSPRRRDRCLKIRDRDFSENPSPRLSAEKTVRFVCSWLLEAGSHFPVLLQFA